MFEYLARFNQRELVSLVLMIVGYAFLLYAFGVPGLIGTFLIGAGVWLWATNEDQEHDEEY